MKILFKLIYILVLTLAFSLVAQPENPSADSVQLDKNFYKELLKISPIKRDEYFDKILNDIVQGKGSVKSVESKARYKKKYRITEVDPVASNLNIIFYLFTDNEDYVTLLKKGDTFDYKGQFVIYTPVSTKCDSYILDIILEEGALSIE